MNETLIIIFRQNQLLCCRLVGDDFREVLIFPFESQPLFAWLKNFPGASVHLLLDLIEEEVYIENSPMLFTWEQKFFAERQMRKRFPKTEFCQFRFVEQKALPWQSRSGFLLVSGFNDDVNLITLLEWLDTACVSVLSIHSVALLFPNLFKEIWFSQPKQAVFWQEKPHFLLSRTDKDGFRQSLIVDGVLRTIRQIQLRDQADEDQAQQLLQEIKMLDKFVHSQKMVEYDHTPDVYYLGDSEQDSEAVWQVFQATPYATAGRESFISATSVIPASYVEPATVNDVLQLLAFNRRTVDGDYFPKSVIETKIYRQIKYGLWAAFFGLVISFFAYSAYFMAKAVSFDSSINALQNQHARYQVLSVKLQSQLKTTVPTDQLKSSVELVDSLQTASAKQDTVPYFVGFSEVLLRYPHIRLLEMAWSPDVGGGAVQKEIKLDASHFKLDITAAIVADSHMRLRTVLEMMDSFLAELTQNKSIQNVELVQKPVDLDSSRTLVIKADDRVDSVQEYPFKLVISFKPPL